jgi:cyclin B
MQEEGSEVTDKMRQILVDWLVDVHQTFNLKEETLHLALHYLSDY